MLRGWEHVWVHGQPGPMGGRRPGRPPGYCPEALKASRAGLLATPQKSLLSDVADSALGSSRGPDKNGLAAPVLGWLPLVPLSQPGKRPERWVPVPALVFTD